MTVKTRFHRRVFVIFFPAHFSMQFCRAQVASSNRVSKLAAILARFGRDLSRDVAEVCNLVTTFGESQKISAKFSSLARYI